MRVFFCRRCPDGSGWTYHPDASGQPLTATCDGCGDVLWRDTIVRRRRHADGLTEVEPGVYAPARCSCGRHLPCRHC